MPTVIIPPTDVSPNTGSGSEVLSTSPNLITPTISVGATTTAATDLLVNPAVKASGNLLDLQVASSSKFSVSSAGNGTFGGNLTVNGTGLSSVAGALNVTGALLAHQTAALNMAHEGSSLSQLVSYGADASTYGRLNVTLRKAGTGVGAVTALALTSTDATFGGNLTTGSNSTISASAGYLLIQPTTTLYLRATSGSVAIADAGSGTVSLGQPGSTTTVQGNLTVIGGTIGTAASTSLTLNGGSSGASLVLSSGNANSLLTAKGSTSSAILTLHNSRTTETNVGLAITNAYPNAASRNWAFAINNSAFGDLAILQSNALGGDAFTAGTNALYISPARNLLLGTTIDGGQKLQVAGTGLFSTTEPTITLSSTAVGSIAYQLISGGGSGHALGAFKIYDSSTGYVVLNHDKPTSGGTRLSFDGAGNATLAGNLTVSGTGTSTFSGDIKIQKANAQLEIRSASDAAGQFQYLTFGSPNYNRAQFRSNNQGVADGAISLYTFDAGIPVVAQYWTKSGNSLLGTTTDSGNGKLQLATHTTSAGGIGFGTDVSLYRTTSNILTFGAGNACGFYLRDTNTSTNLSEFYSDTAQTFFGTKTALPLIIRTNNTTALTLSGSDQSATFAGTVKGTTLTASQGVLTLGTAGGGGGDNIYFAYASNAASRTWNLVSDITAFGDFAIRQSTTQSGSTYANALYFDASRNATFAGAIAIGNTVQTAASVASTHKVTVVIGGVTYYLLATNV